MVVYNSTNSQILYYHWKHSRNSSSTTEAAAHQPRAGETLPSASVRDLGGLLKDSGYEVFLKDGSLYGFKGISGRFAPIAVHVSLVLILLGAAIGALGGLEGTVRPPSLPEPLLEPLPDLDSRPEPLPEPDLDLALRLLKHCTVTG